MVWPNAERLKRVLGDEAAVLADDHDGRDGRSLNGVAIHRRLHLNARILAYGPLAVAAAGTTASTTGFQSGYDFVFLVR
jgi:hypothetical protein